MIMASLLTIGLKTTIEALYQKETISMADCTYESEIQGIGNRFMTLPGDNSL